MFEGLAVLPHSDINHIEHMCRLGGCWSSRRQLCLRECVPGPQAATCGKIQPNALPQSLF